MNRYQFEQIVKEMEKRCGKMRKGEEEKYSMMLFPMESNLLKVWRRHPESNSRRLGEAACLALHEVKGHMDGGGADTTPFESMENRRLKEALLASFDPFTNSEIQAVLGGVPGDLDGYYKIPVMCILRINESVKYWLKRRGSNGYFDFLNESIGSVVADDDVMNYTICHSE